MEKPPQLKGWRDTIKEVAAIVVLTGAGAVIVNRMDIADIKGRVATREDLQWLERRLYSEMAPIAWFRESFGDIKKQLESIERRLLEHEKAGK